MILSLYDFRIAYTCHASVSQRGRIIVVKADFQIVVHMSRVLNFVADVPLLRY